jgi:hypothetical protein
MHRIVGGGSGAAARPRAGHTQTPSTYQRLIQRRTPTMCTTICPTANKTSKHDYWAREIQRSCAANTFVMLSIRFELLIFILSARQWNFTIFLYWRITQ